MRLEVEVLDGARRGLRRRFRAGRVTVGRHPDCDLQFDPDDDRVVSTRHAVLLQRGEQWVVRDLDSRNGTFVNGQPVVDDRRLRSDDHLQFGSEGPEVRVRVLPPAAEAGHPEGEATDTRPVAESSGDGESTTEILRREVTRRGRGLAVVSGLLLLLVGLGAAYYFSGRSGDTAPGTEGSELSLATDSVLQESNRTLDSLRGRVAGLQEALREARRRATSLEEKLRRTEEKAASSQEAGDEADGDSPTRGELEERLQSALSDLRRRTLAAEIDFSAIESRHWRALARVFVQGADGSVTTATAFSVRSEGLLITAQHAVLEADGSPAPRIGIQFARSDQIWPGKLVATTDRADLALIRAENVVGEVPTITEFSDDPDTLLSSGSPVAVMGYSGGTEGGGAGNAADQRLPRPRLTAGILMNRNSGLYEVRGLGAEGGSGSPIFDASGQVVGVLRGGASEDSSRMLLAVPSPVVTDFVSAVLQHGAP